MRWLRTLVLAGLFCAATPFVGAEVPTDLDILTEDLPPYAYFDQGALRGLSVDIVQEILSRLHQKRPIRVVPWARAYEQIRHSDHTVLFTMARSPERAPLFRWIGPIAVDRTSFYKRRESSVEVSSIEGARSLRVLVTRDYPEEALIRSLGFIDVFVTSDPETNWRMLLKDRGDLTVSGRNTFAVNLKNMGIPPAEFVPVGPPLFETELFIAMSLAAPDEVYGQWTRTFAEMERDGTVARLRSLYLPAD